MLSATCHLLHSNSVPYALRLFPNTTSALEGKMVHTYPKPRNSGHMENGVCVLWSRVKHMGNDLDPLSQVFSG